ncbi:MAG: DNRLRE domain-containing protein [Phycisphaeraceae bacterium]|nr:DNRLRE domain-containing protein [Phycisphaeraceae bacterium]
MSNSAAPIRCLPLLLSCGVAHAGSLSLSPVADNTLYQSDSGGLSNGAGSAMFAGMNAFDPTTIRRCVMRFDIAGSVPSGMRITSAVLSLTQIGSNGDPQSCSLYRLLASWGEGASTALGGQGGGASASANDATWLHRFWPGTTWATPGGDFASAASATTSVGGFDRFSWSSPELVADAQFMLDHPASDFGWILRGNESAPQSAKKFSTREDLTASNRPALVLEYTPRCTGDLNQDDVVEDSDFVLFATSYNLLDCTDASIPTGCPADFNGDGFVDDSDFVVFVAAYNDLVCP